MEKRDKAKQQAEYYQKKADTEPGKHDFLFKEALDDFSAELLNISV